VSTPATTDDLWEAMSTARAIRRFTAERVDPAVLGRALQAATWAPSGGNQQPWRFVVLDSPASREALATGAARAMANIERVYRMTRPAPDDDSPRARTNRATYALHDGAATVPTAVLFCVKEQPSTPALMLGGSIYPAMQNFLLAARALGLGACVTGWQVGGEPELRAGVGVPPEWHLASIVILGWPAGHHGPLRRRPLAEVAVRDRWDQPFTGSAATTPA
jgi:nitroreductase